MYFRFVRYVHRDQLRAQRSVTSMGKLYLFTSGFVTRDSCVMFAEMFVENLRQNDCRDLPIYDAVLLR